MLFVELQSTPVGVDVQASNAMPQTAMISRNADQRILALLCRANRWVGNGVGRILR
ncbi:MAG TPA: hypothetical protein VG963_26685 [Polyangiaceae bacterium]|nr:hypothetical protein [Polyangiaceae bacterium]